jgi:hypothetical protein
VSETTSNGEAALNGASQAPVSGEPAPTPATDPTATEPTEPAVGTEVVSPTAATHAFGRVDEAGVVYVRTAAAEVAVGSYQAGSPQEALAYFARKFEGVLVELDLLEKRVATGEVAPNEAEHAVARLRESVDHPPGLGDIEGLRARLDALGPAIAARRAAAGEQRARARAEALAARERIVDEAESLAESTSWKVTGDRLKALLDEWKAAPRIDRGTEQSLWKRFSAARNAFDRRRRTHFAQLGHERAEAKSTKEQLVAEAEQLATSTDWASTATRFRNLMNDWKAAGKANRDVDDTLWRRFRAAQDAFFAARNANLSERDAGQSGNLHAKEALVVEAEALLPVSDLAAAKASLRSIHERWEAIGHVPREQRDRVEGRLRKVEQAVRDAEQARWRRTNPEARARAEATVSQLRDSIAKLESDAAGAEAAGKTAEARNANEAIAARKEWLAEAEKALAEFSGE